VRHRGRAQFAVEQAVTALHAVCAALTGQGVCLSGGVALNCVANGLLPEPLFAPPVPHDAGVALGAAWAVSPPATPTLGHRSIVALPRPAAVLASINDRKGREQWRPLAPVARRGGSEGLWPDQGSRSTFMTGSAMVGERAHTDMPAAIHVHGRTKAQNLEPGTAPALESILLTR
jgi:carbamoyltransferase